MNDRIRQLAEQATTRIEPTATSGEGWVFDKEKFAQLIVRECAMFSMVITDDHYDVDALYRHFGVEE
jgi:hypothetical protein